MAASSKRSDSLSVQHRNRVKLTRTLLSPPEVANLPFPCGSKCAEKIGVPSLCHCTSSGVAFIAADETVSNKLEQTREQPSQILKNFKLDGRNLSEMYVVCRLDARKPLW